MEFQATITILIEESKIVMMIIVYIREIVLEN